MLETLEHAQKRGAPIIAEYLGGAVTCDAYHMTDPRKDGLGVSSCIELAIKDAGIDRDQVSLPFECLLTVLVVFGTTVDEEHSACMFDWLYLCVTF